MHAILREVTLLMSAFPSKFVARSVYSSQSPSTFSKGGAAAGEAEVGEGGQDSGRRPRLVGQAESETTLLSKVNKCSDGSMEV